MSNRSMVHGPLVFVMTLAFASLACESGGGDTSNFGASSSDTASTASTADPPDGSTGATTDSPTTDAPTTGAMDGPPPGLYPRWLLRDKNGAPVRAIVEPHCGGDPEDCRVPDIGEPPDFRCVHVTMHEDRYVGLLFGVADGDPLTCNLAPLPSPQSTCSAQPDCNGSFFHNVAEEFDPDRPDAPRTTFRRGDELFFVSSEPIEPDQCFFVDIIDGCLPSNGPTKPLFPILPIPAEFMTLLLDGAPYTLEAAYD